MYICILICQHNLHISIPESRFHTVWDGQLRIRGKRDQDASGELAEEGICALACVLHGGMQNHAPAHTELPWLPLVPAHSTDAPERPKSQARGM